MAADAPRLFTIPPDRPFLEVLARAVLGGFPCADPKPPGALALGGWTILLPTRRAVRELEEIFFRLTGSTGVLLPRISPLGDIDEDLMAPVAFRARTCVDAQPAPIPWRELSDLAPYGLLEHHGAGFQPVVLRVPGLPAVPRKAGPAADAQYARR